MTKRMFLVFVFALSLINLYAQTSGIKLLNQPTKIKSGAAKVDIELNDDTKTVYRTLEIIRFNYLAQDRTTRETELETLQKDLYDNSVDIPANRYTDDVIKTKMERIAVLKSELAVIRHQQDSLYHLYVKDYLNFKRKTVLTFGARRSQAFFDIIYDGKGKKFNTLNSTGFNIGDKTGSLYSEFVSGNLGLFRVSLGGMVSSNSESDPATAKEEEAYQRLVTYGGNTVLNFEYPLAYIHSRNSQYNFISRFVAKGTADFPAFGTDTEDWAGSGSFGVDFYGDASLSNNALRFFFNFNVNQIYGTKTFKENLGIDKSNFVFGRLTLGLVVMENLKFSLIISSFSSEKSLRNGKVVAGGQVLH